MKYKYKTKKEYAMLIKCYEKIVESKFCNEVGDKLQ